MKFALGVYFTVPSAASITATVPLAPCVTAMIDLPAFSKLSLPNKPLVTLPSSATVALSPAMSASAVTITVIVRVATLPALSVTETVKLSGPW